MKKIIFTFIWILLGAWGLTAQNCYDKFRGEGIDFMEKKHDYATAINRFWAAMISCTDGPQNNDLSELIKDAQTRWVRDLENAVSREKKAYQEAVVAKEQAEKARAAEEAVRKDLEVKERLAKERGQRAETLRLTLLADLVRQKSRKTDALMLSWLAMQLSGADIAPLVSRAFNEAVRDSFTTTLFTAKTDITGLEYFNRNQHLLIRTADGGIHILPQDNRAPVAIQDAEATGVAVSAQTPWIVTWHQDKKAKLWNADGTLVATLEGHTEAIRQAAFTSDGSSVITSSRDNTAKIWDLQGKVLVTLTGHTGNVYDAQSAPDNQHLLTRAYDGTARIWDRNGQPLGVISADNDFLYDARWMPSGQEIAALFAGGSVGLWSLQGKLLTTLSNTGVKGMAVDKGKDGLLILDNDLKIKRFDAKGNQIMAIEHAGMVGFSVDETSNFVFSKDAAGGVRAWQPDGHLAQELRGHRAAVFGAAYSASRDAFLTTSKDGTAKLWDAKGNMTMEWPLGRDAIPPARFTPDGKYVLVVNNNGKSVSQTPFPEDIYKTISLTDEVKNQLIKTYNVELFEALVKKG